MQPSPHTGVALSKDSLRSQSPGSSENLRTTHVIANQCAHWCGNPFPKAFPWGGAPRSELKSNNCQWQLLHNVKVARASPASARRMRASCRTLIYKMQNAKCKMRMRKEIVIAAQSADWCGNPSVFQNAIGNACHCEPVRRLVWQSVTPAFPWGKVPAAAGG